MWKVLVIKVFRSGVEKMSLEIGNQSWGELYEENFYKAFALES